MKKIKGSFCLFLGICSIFIGSIGFSDTFIPYSYGIIQGVTNLQSGKQILSNLEFCSLTNNSEVVFKFSAKDNEYNDCEFIFTFNKDQRSQIRKSIDTFKEWSKIALDNHTSLSSAKDISSIIINTGTCILKIGETIYLNLQPFNLNIAFQPAAQGTRSVLFYNIPNVTFYSKNSNSLKISRYVALLRTQEDSIDYAQRMKYFLDEENILDHVKEGLNERNKADSMFK